MECIVDDGVRPVIGAPALSGPTDLLPTRRARPLERVSLRLDVELVAEGAGRTRWTRRLTPPEPCE